ncbi:hypothetical protein K488DRAFT_89871 [Vararia minispora EC-137]|uniref:Uncharacterized protein n=1 Tax=Vararia minispora EC-137 TaxID=1314806 RepID=A0ACB8Q9F3_9AGAM|nr:hypothetical protein K488DRAFT_89871 [Vararia minispora EC-137]
MSQERWKELPLDIISLIVPLLDRASLLKLRASCRAFNELSIPTLLSWEVVLLDSTRLLSFCYFVLKDATIRGPLLRTLCIIPSAPLPHHIAEILRDVLSYATRLRCLKLVPESLLDWDESSIAVIFDGVQHLPELTTFSIRLGLVNTKLLSVPLVLPHIRTMTVQTDRDATDTFDVLAPVAPILEELRLLSWYHLDDSPDVTKDLGVVFPRLIHLTALDGYFRSLAPLTQSFPALRTLTLNDDHDLDWFLSEDILFNADNIRDANLLARSWRTLDALTGASGVLFRCAVRAQVHKLTVHDVLFTELGARWTQAVVRDTRPTFAYVLLSFLGPHFYGPLFPEDVPIPHLCLSMPPWSDGNPVYLPNILTGATIADLVVRPSVAYVSDFRDAPEFADTLRVIARTIPAVECIELQPLDEEVGWALVKEGGWDEPVPEERRKIDSFSNLLKKCQADTMVGDIERGLRGGLLYANHGTFGKKRVSFIHSSRSALDRLDIIIHLRMSKDRVIYHLG